MRESGSVSHMRVSEQILLRRRWRGGGSWGPCLFPSKFKKSIRPLVMYAISAAPPPLPPQPPVTLETRERPLCSYNDVIYTCRPLPYSPVCVTHGRLSFRVFPTSIPPVPTPHTAPHTHTYIYVFRGEENALFNFGVNLFDGVKYISIYMFGFGKGANQFLGKMKR